MSASDEGANSPVTSQTATGVGGVGAGVHAAHSREPAGEQSRRLEGIAFLQRHPGVREALVVLAQLGCAAVIYADAALLWKLLGGGAGRPGVVTVVAATVVVAVVLSRTRSAFERAVNWLAFGERADGYELAVGFLKRLATTMEIDDVLPRLAETAARTVGSQRGEVRVWMADGSSWRQTWPLDASTGRGDVTVPVRHSGDHVGEMAVSVPADDLSPVDRRLLDELAGPAGLALSTVRLTHALRQQAAEIEATATQIRSSRERIVNARRDEQARIRDQLDTRVCPLLDTARAQVGKQGRPDTSELAAAADRVEGAISELRQIARGLFPARLAEAGIATALRGWAEETGHRIDLFASGDIPRLEREADLTAALYFCAVTALADTSGVCRVALDVSDTEATIEMRLSEPADPATRLALSDRAQAFDGDVGWHAVHDGGAIMVRICLPLTIGAVR
jgi:hypothetical protein